MWYRVSSELTLFYMRCWMQRNLKQTARSLMLVAPTEMTHRGSRGSAIWEEMNSSARLMTITSRTTSTSVDWAVKCLTMIMLWIWFWMLNRPMVSFLIMFFILFKSKMRSYIGFSLFSWYSQCMLTMLWFKLCACMYAVWIMCIWSFCTSAVIG